MTNDSEPTDEQLLRHRGLMSADPGVGEAIAELASGVVCDDCRDAVQLWLSTGTLAQCACRDDK